METARQLARLKEVSVFRAGIWKPRTRPNSFEGVGSEGLKWLRRVKQETGLLVGTEVANEKHVYEALKYGIDMLWIGARTSVNPFTVQEISDALNGVDVMVLVKNPINPDIEFWMVPLNVLQEQELQGLGQFIVDFLRMKRLYTGISLTGSFLLNCGEEFPTCQLSAIRVILEVPGNFFMRFHRKQWT